MPDARVFLFPGLGAYAPGMLREARHFYPQVVQTIKEIDQASAEHGVGPVAEILFGPEPTPLTDLSARPAEMFQLAVFGASIATLRVLTDEGVEPDLLVGHSFGEIAALVAGGALDLVDGVRMVLARAEALRPWEGKGAMAAIGTDEATAAHLIGVLNDGDLVIGCHNAPRQTVLSGPIPSIERAEKVAAALNLFCTRLHLPYASHHPMFLIAVEEFCRLMSDIRQRPLQRRVLSPIHQRVYTDGDDLRRAIAECLVLPVRFTDTVRRLHARGAEVFIEVGARNALTRCVELTVPDVTTVAPLRDPEAELQGLRHAVAACLGERPGPVRLPEHRTVTAQPEVVAAPLDAVIPVRQEQRQPASGGGLTRAEVFERLCTMYAETLEYPLDVLTESAHLEADLGVDSLKQTALLNRVVEEFHLPPAADDTTVVQVNTLGQIVDRVITRLDQPEPR
jgi:[acyl-carrier-protein] S-malonyltransferase